MQKQGSERPWTGSLYDDVSEGDALLPTSQQNRRKRLRPAVGAAVACVAAFGAVAVVANARTTDLRRSNDPEIGNVGRRSAAKTPTIVVSLLDDQGYADVPWLAQDAATQSAMPFADALRKDAGGVDVKNYHTWRDCTPSRAMLLTGRHHAQLGMHVPLLAGATAALPTDEQTIGELLEKARPGAYHRPSSASGTWARLPQIRPHGAGLRRLHGFYNAMIDYFDWTIESVAMTDIAGTILDAQRNDGPSPKAAGRTRRGSCATRRSARSPRPGPRARRSSCTRPGTRSTTTWPSPTRTRGQPVYMKAVGLGLPQERALALAAAHRRRGERVDLLAPDRDNTIWIQTSDNGGEPTRAPRTTRCAAARARAGRAAQVPCFVWLGANPRARSSPTRASSTARTGCRR